MYNTATTMPAGSLEVVFADIPSKPLVSLLTSMHIDAAIFVMSM